MFIYKTLGGARVKTHAPKSHGGGAAPLPTPATGGQVAIGNSVGNRGRNDRNDVTTIQSALVRIGPAQGGQSRDEAGHNIRLDTIYLCPDLKKLSEDIKAFVVVHELAHFVGHPEYIDDHAYNFQGKGAKNQSLTPQLRMLNAESYANFAFESSRGQDPPVF